MNKSRNSLGTNQPNKLRRRLEVSLIIAVILILTLTACAPTLPPIPTETFVPSAAVPTSTSTEIPVTATATLIVAQEPPPCTFPLAQITTAESAPETYTFSEPKVVLIAPQGNLYSIVEWLPDNQQVLITEELRNGFVEANDNVLQQSIELYNLATGKLKVYATRTDSDEPPVWNPELNAVVYPAINYTSIDKAHDAYKFTRQVWVSHGDPNAAQKLDDNLPQLPLAVKPDGSQMLYFSDKQLSKRNGSMQAIPSTSFDHTQWDYAKSRRNNNPVSYEMAWQPGTSLIFLYSNGSTGGGGYTFILNADTGRVCELNLGGWALVAHWSSDGRYLAIIRATEYYFPINTSDLALLNTVTGNLTTLNVTPQETEGQHLYDFVWVPDNHHLLVLGSPISSQNNQGGGDDISGLYLVDTASDQSVNIVPTYKLYTHSPQSMAWSPDGSKLVIDCSAAGLDKICLISVLKTGQ